MSTPSPAPVEDRLRSALATEAAAAWPAADDSLATIRTRVRTARRRRAAVLAGVAAVAVVATAVAIPRLGRDRDPVRIVTPPATDESVPVQPAPGPSHTPTSVPSETIPQPADMVPMWPVAGGPTYNDPVDAARAFIAAALGVADARLSDVTPAGQIDVLSKGEKGTAGVTTVSHLTMRQDGDGHWSVVRATSDDVAIQSPAPAGPDTGPSGSPPLHVTGQGRGAGGVLTVAVLSADEQPVTVGSGTATAGEGAELVPFATDVALGRSPGGPGILLVHDDVSQAGIAGAVPSFAAQALVLPPAGAAATGSFRYVPLFPFADRAAVDEWRAADAEGGHQPWHRDPEATALAFAKYLHLDEIDAVTSRDVRDQEAWIGIGTRFDDGSELTAAVVHLARWGSGPDAPWEVAGTRDTDLTLEIPHYRSAVSSPLTVGGHITGVDENLKVQVFQLSSSAAIGEKCCLPAGDVNRPWTTTVTYAGARDDVLTVLVTTGGHRQGVERFAVTGVRPR